MIIRRALLGLVVVMLSALLIGLPSSAPKAQIIPMAFWQSGSAGIGGTALRFRAANNACLTRTMTGSATTWTISMWVKSANTAPVADLFTSVQTTGQGQQGGLGFSNPGGTYLGFWSYHPTPGYQTRKVTSAAFRDPTAWYHLVTVWDTNNAVAEDRMRMYVNGVRVTSFSANTVPGSLGMGHQVINNGFGMGIGCQNRDNGTVMYPFDGYIADVKYVDSQALDASSFGQMTNNMWVPKTYAGTYNANSFWLKFTEAGVTSGANTGFGKDFWNSNYWNTTGISATAGATYDGVDDYPVTATGEGNYATINPTSFSGSLTWTDVNSFSAGSTTLTNGATVMGIQNTGTAAMIQRATTICPQSGKWYFEVENLGSPSSAGEWWNVALFDANSGGLPARPASVGASAAKFWLNDGTVYAGGDFKALNTIMAIAYDLDAGKVWIGRALSGAGSMTWASGDPSAGTSPTGTWTPDGHAICPSLGGYQMGASSIMFRSGGHTGGFKYAPPSGFNALSTSNLPAPAIATPSSYFKTVTYTGNGTYQSIGEAAKQTSSVSLANSLRFKAASSAYLTRTPSTTGNKRKWTFSAWYKPGYKSWFDATGASPFFEAGDSVLTINNGGGLQFFLDNTSTARLITTAALRDPSSWHHIVLAVDTDQGTSSNKLKLYIDGVQVTAFTTANYPGAVDTDFNTSGTALKIGYSATYGNYFDGYMADVYWIDGSQLDATSFGQYDADGDWAPKAYAASYGTNGFHLDFADNSNVGKDVAGSNNLTANNFTTDNSNPFLFKPTGFQVGSNSLINTNTNNYVSWNWKKGTLPGFDVVTYTGTGANINVSHGLGVVPNFVITKSINASSTNWLVYHSSIGTGKYLTLNSTGGTTTDANAYTGMLFNYWGHTGSSPVNVSGQNYVSYAFAEVPGFSKFGSYTGNGSANGPFTYTGFKPAFVMIKRTDSTGNWQIMDSAREKENPYGQRVVANDAMAEADVGDRLDFLSNGFKNRDTDTDMNAAGATYIYAAFAEAPFKEQSSKANLDVLNGLRFNSANVPYLTRTPSSTGNRKTWTWSGWVKRASMGSLQQIFTTSDGTYYDQIYFGADDALYLNNYGASSGGAASYIKTNALFRDTGVWYHVLASVDTTVPTRTLYVNGVAQSVTSGGGGSFPQNGNLTANVSGAENRLGRNITSNTNYLNGYLADVYLIDGQALTPSAFGEANSAGLWVPKTYSGTYGTNGVHLQFLNAAAPGTDTSGNANTWISTNITTPDTVGDSPTNNFATLNPNFSNSMTFAEGNLVGTWASGISDVRSTIAVTSGKWYFEMTPITVQSTSDSTSVGVKEVQTGTYAYFRDNGNGMNRGTNSSGDTILGGARWTVGVTYGFAADIDAGTLAFYEANVLKGTQTLPVGTLWQFYLQAQSASSWRFNFGQGGQSGLTYNAASGGTFKYTPPTGFKAVSTTNMAASTIPVPSQYFKAATYTGTGANQTVAVGFQPDLTWIKDRTSGSNGHVLEDSVRVGTSSPYLQSNTAAAQIDFFDASMIDNLTDVPTAYDSTHANYPTLNPLDAESLVVLSGGNLNFTLNGTASQNFVRANAKLPATGKWYWEVTNLTANPYMTGAGMVDMNAPLSSNNSGAAYIFYWSQYGSYDHTYSTVLRPSAFTAWASASSPSAAGDVLRIAYDADNGSMWFGKNGSWFNTSGTANPATNSDPRFSGIPATGNWAPALHGYFNTAYPNLSINFGQRPFVYSVPAGFNRLQTNNLTNASFKPDLVIVKNRTSGTDWAWYDTARGSTLDIATNLTTAQTSQATGLLNFQNGGFTVGSLAKLNTSGNSYTAYMFKKGVTPGFDIVTYTGNGVGGRTIPHSLSAVPQMMICKNLSSNAGYYWTLYHGALGVPYRLFPSNAQAQNSDTLELNNTAPTSSVFTVGTNGTCNGNGELQVTYLWSEVPGFSKFGKYTGNGSAEGPFVYTGFKPAFVLYKNASISASWAVLDTTRSLYNPMSANLYMDDPQAESTVTRGDFLSNGFKIRDTNTLINGNGNTIVYAAFAENPFKGSPAR